MNFRPFSKSFHFFRKVRSSSGMNFRPFSKPLHFFRKVRSSSGMNFQPFSKPLHFFVACCSLLMPPANLSKNLQWISMEETYFVYKNRITLLNSREKIFHVVAITRQLIHWIAADCCAICCMLPVLQVLPPCGNRQAWSTHREPSPPTVTRSDIRILFGSRIVLWLCIFWRLAVPAFSDLRWIFIYSAAVLSVLKFCMGNRGKKKDCHGLVIIWGWT
jgi:hypothetical protein